MAHNEPNDALATRRRSIAEHLFKYRLATCTVALTRPDEHVGGRMIVDIESLADRARGVIEFMSNWRQTRNLPLAVFGEDYCGAAAMLVAAQATTSVKAAGAICGRTDLAQVYLPDVRVPTLLIVPGRDQSLLERNEKAFSKLACASQIAVIGNASRMMRETGAVRACQYLIRRWCQKYFARCGDRANAP
jgi:hypothetical protein